MAAQDEDPAGAVRQTPGSKVDLVVEAKAAAVGRRIVPPQGKLRMIAGETGDVGQHRWLAVAPLQVPMAAGALDIVNPRQGCAAMLAMTAGTVAFGGLFVMQWTLVARGAGMVGDRGPSGVAGPQPGGRLKDIDVALPAIVPEQGMGRG
jgi:hypothetical protein